jgi:alginate O-acetyltransferase complex protein AlgI
MLFNSFAFVLVFLPVSLAGFFLLSRISQGYGAAWLALASIIFYGVWDIRYVPLLIGSAAFNFTVGEGLIYYRGRSGLGRSILAAAITVNLTFLGYFKYEGFFLENMHRLLSYSFAEPRIVLPLGISFFTFTQIAYLVDTWQGRVSERNPVHYILFVTYFPHLIAGPILHHSEMMPQFRVPSVYRLDFEKCATGLCIFVFGLFKKVVLADGIAKFVGTVFDTADRGIAVSLPDAWGGALAYTFQLYFDFSGYCDMAIGISWLFGIALPLNFDSPYKATSIIAFWRCWHITLSRFLRDYLYIPLGGNRQGLVRRYINLFVTMTIGGLWHGAGWTFVAWGALHGAYLFVNHAWLGAPRMRLRLTVVPPWVRTAIAWLLTFLAVVVGWVLFRAHTISGASDVLAGMAGLHRVVAQSLLPGAVWGWCIALGSIALLLPNTQEIMHRYFSGITRPSTIRSSALPLVFHRSVPWAAAVAAMLAAGLIGLPRPTSFLYFNF